MLIGAALALGAVASSARAAATAGQAGSFLQQQPGARGAALGGARTALTDDSSSLHWNPAGLARLVKPEGAATHVTLFEDTSYDFLAGGFPVRKWGGFAGGFIRQCSGGFERRANRNEASTTFSISQSAWVSSWGSGLPYVDVGLAAKSVREDHRIEREVAQQCGQR